MTEKEKIEELQNKLAELNMLYVSEKEMNASLKKHIENLNFQIEAQSALMNKFCHTIGDLRFKITTLISDKFL